MRILERRLEPLAETEINMIIDRRILDELTARAKASPRLWINYDLRNTAADQSQRKLMDVAVLKGDRIELFQQMLVVGAKYKRVYQYQEYILYTHQ